MIGEGGMGKVYKATQLMLDKPVVLKVLRQALLSDERTVARFQREAKAASRLNHPNSISILDYGQGEDGALYIAMEYVAGKDLHHILSREWPLPEARVARIVGQVLSALSDAHGAGVIHRDLKPENIMVEQRRGEPDFVKVLDFGIAKIMDTPAGDEGPALTRAGFVCGTPEYMSPEQARGAALDHRSDLYAVGVILYQLVSGLLPFDSDSAVGFATKHLTEQPPLPSRRRPDAKISPAMERLVMKALSKNPADRPQTAEQFRAELQAIDKERRAQVGTRRGNAASNGVLAPMPRRMTPLDQQETRIGDRLNEAANPGWTDQTQQTTLNTTPGGSTSPDGPVPRPSVGLEPATSPERTRPGLDATQRYDSAPFKAPSTLPFKIATVVLVVVALAIAGLFIYGQVKGPQVPDGPRPPQTPMPLNPADLTRLYEKDIPKEQRDAVLASKLASAGDEAWHRGAAELAIAKYKEAFARDPLPETALKLGELYFQREETGEARSWFDRHRKDAPNSHANAYIEQVMPAK
ncbi:MAG: serine/threonine protein kinase [Myxococcaceae bacterium]|nr:serine/threonine protein kinase [Myxococcaceae bacterium]